MIKTAMREGDIYQQALAQIIQLGFHFVKVSKLYSQGIITSGPVYIISRVAG